MNQLIDLSHIIEDGLVTYKGLPAPIICDYLSREESKNIYAEGTEFQIGKIEMVTNTGTYIDCPFHRYKNGHDLAGLHLEKVVDIPGILIQAPYSKQKAIDASFFKGLDLTGKAVLVNTGWDNYWNTPSYYENNPFLTEDAATFLKEQEVVLVGIDSHNIDDTSHNTRPVHSILLGAEILIVEHLCHLEKLAHHSFSFTAVPPKFKGAGTFPVRAFAKILDK